MYSHQILYYSSMKWLTFPLYDGKEGTKVLNEFFCMAVPWTGSLAGHWKQSLLIWSTKRQCFIIRPIHYDNEIHTILLAASTTESSALRGIKGDVGSIMHYTGPRLLNEITPCGYWHLLQGYESSFIIKHCVY